MVKITKPNDLILPIPETEKEQDLYKELQDFNQSISQTFSDLEDIENTEAGSGLIDTGGVYSVDVDDSTIQIGTGGLEVIEGGVDHDSLLNTHNLTTDIDHDQLTNYDADEHFTESSISIPHSQISDYDSELAGTSNTTAFTPDSDYEPATKKYVDDNSVSEVPMIEQIDTGTFTDDTFTVSETASNGDSYKFVAEWYSNNQSVSSIQLTFNGDSSGGDYDVLMSKLEGGSSPAESYSSVIGEDYVSLPSEIESYHKLILEISVRGSKTVCKFNHTVINDSDIDEMSECSGTFLYGGGTMTSIDVASSNTNQVYTGSYYLGKYTS